jgi:hypothetical protein
MKKLLLLVLVLVAQASFAQNGFRFNDIEYFTISVSVDPSSSFKEKGLDIVSELEYVGKIYAKIGVESFSTLYQGYQDIHYGIGLNFTSGYFNNIRYYVGFRQARVVRNDTWRINHGLEGGIQYKLADNFAIGLRTTLDKRYDLEIQDTSLKPIARLSNFITVLYRWDYKPRY